MVVNSTLIPSCLSFTVRKQALACGATAHTNASSTMGRLCGLACVMVCWSIRRATPQNPQLSGLRWTRSDKIHAPPTRPLPVRMRLCLCACACMHIYVCVSRSVSVCVYVHVRIVDENLHMYATCGDAESRDNVSLCDTNHTCFSADSVCRWDQYYSPATGECTDRVCSVA
jgi:hypothetical protein